MIDRIVVKYDELEKLAKQYRETYDAVNEVLAQLNRSIDELDWEIKEKATFENNIKNIVKKASKFGQLSLNISSYINGIVKTLGSTDKKITGKLQSGMETVNNQMINLYTNSNGNNNICVGDVNGNFYFGRHNENCFSDTCLGFMGDNDCGADVQCGSATCALLACYTAKCFTDMCAAAACHKAACGLEHCVGAACGGAASLFTQCVGAACAGDACGYNQGGYCAGAACGAVGCSTQLCAADASLLEVCGKDICGGEACGGDACGAESCFGDACGAQACSAKACGGNACGADFSQLADIGPCAINFVPFIPFI